MSPVLTAVSTTARAACDLVERVQQAGLAAESADELLILDSWNRMLVPADRDDMLHETREMEIVRIFDSPFNPLDAAPQEAHLCKRCHSFQSGIKLDARIWLCGSCRELAPY